MTVPVRKNRRMRYRSSSYAASRFQDVKSSDSLISYPSEPTVSETGVIVGSKLLTRYRELNIEVSRHRYPQNQFSKGTIFAETYLENEFGSCALRDVIVLVGCTLMSTACVPCGGHCRCSSCFDPQPLHTARCCRPTMLSLLKTLLPIAAAIIGRLDC